MKEWNRWTEDEERIVAMLAGKIPANIIASFVERSEASVISYANRNEISVSFSGRGNFSIDNRDFVVSEIKRMIKLGSITNRLIAKKIGVKESYVANIKRRMNNSVKQDRFKPTKTSKHLNLIDSVMR